MRIQQYKEDALLHEQLKADFEKYNNQPIDDWQSTYYLAHIRSAIANDECWITDDDSIMVINDNLLIYSVWNGTALDDFLFLFETLEPYNDLRVVPLGKYFHDLSWLMNNVSMKKFHLGQVSCIRLEIAKYDIPDIKEYF